MRKKAESAVCAALQDAELICDEKERESKCEKEKAQVRSLVRALDFAVDALDASTTIVEVIGTLATAAALVARFVPQAAPAAIVLQRTAQEAVAARAALKATIEYAKLMVRLQGGEVPRELAHLVL